MDLCKTIFLKIFSFFLASLLVVSCGKGFKEDVSDAQREEIELDESSYHVTFVPLNSRVGIFYGWGAITISDDDQFWVRTKVQGHNTQVNHQQHIQSLKRCPQMSDDTNHDGYVDFIEASAVAGKILIPLDTNLTSQLRGIADFPLMKGEKDFYYYSESTATSTMIRDLLKDDPFENDMMVKLKKPEDLKLSRRVIVVYGIDENRFLPLTVASYGGYPANETLPIACGEIQEGESPEVESWYEETSLLIQ